MSVPSFTGCFCPAGMVELGKRCVLPSDCPTIPTEEEKSRPTRKSKPDPPSCSEEGKVYMECGTACPRTCDNPSLLICTKQCVDGKKL